MSHFTEREPWVSGYVEPLLQVKWKEKLMEETGIVPEHPSMPR